MDYSKDYVTRIIKWWRAIDQSIYKVKWLIDTYNEKFEKQWRLENIYLIL